MKFSAVIGSNYGDEGKGLTTDWLARQSKKSLVVRYNGGAQAGHTVVTPENKRHIFSHFGSGTLTGSETYLGQNFICNPLLFVKEKERLGFIPKVHVNPFSRVTTYLDMMANQLIEEDRAKDKHGSCGLGIFETIERHKQIPFCVTDEVPSFEIILDYFLTRIRNEAPNAEKIAIEKEFISKRFYDRWLEDLEFFKKNITIKIPDSNHYDSVIFEGAQGLLLDMDNINEFPHLTPSNTGLFGALGDLHDLNVDSINAYYITRSYLTRHGNGPLKNAIDNCKIVDKTNLPNKYQGRLRFAPLDVSNLAQRIFIDTNRSAASQNLSIKNRLVITHTNKLNIFENNEKQWYDNILKEMNRINVNECFVSNNEISTSIVNKFCLVN